MSKRKKQIPVFFNLDAVASFVETNVEIPKETLLKRITGKVQLEMLNLIKLLQFYTISKNEKGELFIL